MRESPASSVVPVPDCGAPGIELFVMSPRLTNVLVNVADESGLFTRITLRKSVAPLDHPAETRNVPVVPGALPNICAGIAVGVEPIPAKVPASYMFTELGEPPVYHPV